MSMVWMDIAGARDLAATLRLDARALDVASADLRSAYTTAREVLPAAGSAVSPLVAIEAASVDLERMALDLSWRADMLEAADSVTISRGRRRAGTLPERALHLVDQPLSALVALITGGDLADRARSLPDVLHEVVARASTDAGRRGAVAAEFIVTLGPEHATALVGTMPLIARRHPDSVADLIAMAELAATSGNQPAITVMAQTITAVHFAHQNRMLSVIADHFDELDTATQRHRTAPQDRTSHVGDGIVSIADLEAASAGAGPLAEAAGWLASNPQVVAWLAMGETNRTYLAEEAIVPAGLFSSLDRFRLTDIDHYRLRRDTAFVVSPLLQRIDTASSNDPSDRDGFVSRDDFIEALAWDDLADFQRRAIVQVLQDRAYDTHSLAPAAITAASWLPAVGDAVDALAALHHLTSGDPSSAAQHGLGVIPVPGLTGGVARYAARQVARRGGRHATQQAARHGVAAAENAASWGLMTPARDALGRHTQRAPAIIDPRDRQVRPAG